MKKSGNRSKFTDAQQLETVIEYLTNDASAAEMGAAIGIGHGAIRQWAHKWRTIAEQSIADMERSMTALGVPAQPDDTESDDEESPF